MRIVLRNIRTRLYLRNDGRWTSELSEARCFRHSAEAMDIARETGLPDVEVLLAFEQPPRQIALPIE
jgi:hypothetical protein